MHEHFILLLQNFTASHVVALPSHALMRDRHKGLASVLGMSCMCFASKINLLHALSCILLVRGPLNFRVTWTVLDVQY